MEVVRSTAMTALASFHQSRRILAVAAVLLIGSAHAWSADDKPGAHHEHAAASGVRSIVALTVVLERLFFILREESSPPAASRRADAHSG